MIRLPATIALAVVLLLFAVSGAAQTEPYAHWRLRSDQAKDLPNKGEVDRVRLHGWLGLRHWWGDNDQLELGGALKFATGDDSNSDNVRFLDNQESDEVGLGEAWLRWSPGSATLIEAGRAPLPLALSAMIWDQDLRPVGVSLQQDFSFRTFDRISLLLGRFESLHIDETRSRLNGGQLSWIIREGAPNQAAVQLSLLDFDRLDGLVEDGRGRTNRRAAGRYLNPYRLLDLQLEMNWSTPFGPVLAQLDLVENLDADVDNQGARLALVMGNAVTVGGWEVGVAWQRIQREAVLGAVNEDDWWFPSAMRGFMPWVRFGFSEHLNLRVAAFLERRDDRPEHLKRLLVDLVFELP